MTVESASYISGLVPAYPPGSDNIAEGDDHLRLIKDVLKKSFPGIDQGVNTIHASATAPSTIVADGSEVGTRGLIWYDTSNNVFKVNTSSTGTASWTVLPMSTSVDYKIMGSPTVGWQLPSADGSANQYLKTDGGGNLDWATIVSPTTIEFKGITQAIQSASSYMRNDTVYATTGYAITHNKTSATSDLYVMLNCFITGTSNFEHGTAWTTNLRLAKGSSPDSGSEGDLVAGTTDDLQCVFFEDVGQGTGVTYDLTAGYSRVFNVTAANCPMGTTGDQRFGIWAKITADGADGGTTVVNGTMTVMEIEA